MRSLEAPARAGWQSLEVRAGDRDHIVRARSGYTAGGGASPSPDVARQREGEGGRVGIVLAFAFPREREFILEELSHEESRAGGTVARAGPWWHHGVRN